MYPSLNVLLIGSSESDFEHWTILHDRICGTGPTGRGRYYRRSRASCLRDQYDRSFARSRFSSTQTSKLLSWNIIADSHVYIYCRGRWLCCEDLVVNLLDYISPTTRFSFVDPGFFSFITSQSACEIRINVMRSEYPSLLNLLSPLL